MPNTVLILEDDPARLARLHAALAAIDPKLEVVTWHDAHQMVRELGSYIDRAVLISLDHDLYPTAAAADDPGDGLDVARYLACCAPRCPVIIHSSNTDRSNMMLGELDYSGWSCVRVAPIGDDWVELDWVAAVRRLL